MPLHGASPGALFVAALALSASPKPNDAREPADVSAARARSLAGFNAAAEMIVIADTGDGAWAIEAIALPRGPSTRLASRRSRADTTALARVMSEDLGWQPAQAIECAGSACDSGGWSAGERSSRPSSIECAGSAC